MKREWIRPLFVVAAVYDLLLGVIFLIAHPAVYARFGVTPPNHPGYVQFAAALVGIFGIGFWYVARAPERNRDIIKLGVLLKLAYSGVVLGWWFRLNPGLRSRRTCCGGGLHTLTDPPWRPPGLWRHPD